MDKKVKIHQPLVTEIIPYNSIGTLAGPTGVGKSLFCHQLGLSLALGVDDFLSFKITKPCKVMYLNFEMNESQLYTRHQKLCENMNTENYNPKGDLNNFQINVLDKETLIFQQNWFRIEKTLEETETPFDLVIVDNLYASTDEDEEKNHKLKPLLGRIANIRDKYKCSILLVTHHIKKQAEDNSLDVKMVRGGSTLTNFVDLVMQMAQSEQDEELKIFKITKSRDGGDTLQVPIGLYLNDETLWLHRGGTVNELIHFEKPKETERDKALAMMKDEFETWQFVDSVTSAFGKSERTAKRWLNKMVIRQQVKNPQYGYYVKVKSDI